MQENNFEKKVQQTMDGLALSPSGEVWKKIQVEIEKKRDKKRRWFIFILFFICLAAGGSIWILQYSKNTVSKNEVSNNNAPINDATALSKALPEEIGVNNKPNTPFETKRLIHQKELDKNQVANNITDKPIASTTPANKRFTPDEISNTGNTEAIYKQKKISRKTTAKTTMQIAEAEVGEVSLVALPTGLSKEVALFSLLEMERLRDITPSIANSNVLYNGLPLLTEKTGMKNTIKTEKSENNNLKKHQNVSFLISFGIGKTATASNYLGATANRIYYNNLSSVGNNNGSSGSGNSSSNIPSYIKPATGLFLGVSAAKPLTKKSSLSIGLQYQFTSTSIYVGQPIVASDGSKTFAVGNSNSYSNQYHFVQIPIELSSQLSHFKKHNLFLNAGVSLSQLLQTNALQFDNTAGRYFRSDDYFNKTIMGVSAGLSINLLKDNEAPLLLGPSFSYTLSSVAGKGLYDKSNYGFLGIRLQKVLKKK